MKSCVLSCKCVAAAVVAAAGVAAFSGWASAQVVGPVHGPDEALPKHLTEREAEHLRRNPLSGLRGVTPPPEGPVRTPAEYEPMDAILLSWNGLTSWKSIVAQMAGHITTTGDADVYVFVRNASDQSQAQSAISSAGADMSRVHLVQRYLDTIWIRDYGPRYIYEGEVRAVVDHTYNRPRPNDDALPQFFAGHRGQAYYKLGLVHGGGNHHLDAEDNGFTTKLILNENPGLTQGEIHQIWMDYQALDTTFYDPLPSSIDHTQHIDMWMQVIGDKEVVISEWPLQQNSVQAQVCEAAASDLASRGYTVHRTPAHHVSGTHYTFTNVVLCNDLVMIPTYTHSTIVGNGFNDQALAAWEQAMPDKAVVQIPAQSIVTYAGVLHCIVMHKPAHVGGEYPTVYLRTPRGGEVFEPDQVVTIRWSSDDRVGVSSVDVLLSLDSGETFEPLATGVADSGEWEWTVPDINKTSARVRVAAYNGLGNSGYDQSESDFTIDGGCPADWNGDGVVDSDDLFDFLADWAAGDADYNGDGVTDSDDLFDFLADWAGGC